MINEERGRKVRSTDVHVHTGHENNISTLAVSLRNSSCWALATCLLKYFFFLVNEALNRLEPWIHPIEWKNGLLGKPIFRKFNNTYQISSKLLYNGKPSEVESDYCILNMLKGYPTETCKVAEECELMLLRNDNPQGYALTHRLLLVWIAKAVSPYN